MAAGANLRRGAQFLAACQRKSESQHRKLAASRNKAPVHVRASGADDRLRAGKSSGLWRYTAALRDGCALIECKRRPLAAL